MDDHQFVSLCGPSYTLYNVRRVPTIGRNSSWTIIDTRARLQCKTLSCGAVIHVCTMSTSVLSVQATTHNVTIIMTRSIVPESILGLCDYM